MVEVPVQDIAQTTLDALTRHGATESIAQSVANAVAVAESNGNRICGLYYVESYCTQLESGRVRGDAQPVVRTDRPGAVRVDAAGGFAQPAFAAGLDSALSAARTNGICGFAIENSHTCTSLGYFTEQIARQGCLAIGATNATARVAPPGGSTPVLGTNPISMAVPDGDGGIAFQFDFSTSATALGSITMAAAAGEDIPLGWAVDAEGNPTTDADAALGGSLLSAGGYKGYGIALMVEMLASALTGTRRSVDVPPLKAAEGEAHNLGQFYIVIDPAAYSDQGFYEHLRSLGESIAADAGARLPGADRQPAAAVEVPDELWEATVALAAPPAE